MSEPRVVVEMQGPNGFSPGERAVPVDRLRKTFFDDLDASSRVNPNRARKVKVTAEFDVAQAYDMMRDVVVGAMTDDETPTAGRSRRSPSVGHSPSPLSEVMNRGMTNRKISLPGDEPAELSTELHDSSSGEALGPSRRRLQATGAMVINAVSGAALGVLARRATSSILLHAGVSFVVMQMLSAMGYASIRWGAMLSDVYGLTFHGTIHSEEELEASTATSGSLQRRLTVLRHRLTASIPRRLSFWLGAAAGVVFL